MTLTTYPYIHIHSPSVVLLHWLRWVSIHTHISPYLTLPISCLYRYCLIYYQLFCYIDWAVCIGSKIPQPILLCVCTPCLSNNCNTWVSISTNLLLNKQSVCQCLQWPLVARSCVKAEQPMPCVITVLRLSSSLFPLICFYAHDPCWIHAHLIWPIRVSDQPAGTHQIKYPCLQSIMQPM
jgi:hypothetical protein